MILDSSLTLDPLGSAITATRPSTNVIDIGNNRDIGIGERDLDLLLQVTSPLVGPGGTTLQAQFQGSLDNATFNTIVETRAVAITGIAVGARLLAINWPRQSPDPDNIASTMYRYFRLNWVVGGGPLTGGAVFASVVLERSDLAFYPSNFAINS